jgi:hypothetical protein
MNGPAVVRAFSFLQAAHFCSGYPYRYIPKLGKNSEGKTAGLSAVLWVLSGIATVLEFNFLLFRIPKDT